jgi:hypothetical protein
MARTHEGVEFDGASLSVSLNDMVDLVLCPKAAGQEHHRKECIMGTCKECGPDNKLVLKPWEDPKSSDDGGFESIPSCKYDCFEHHTDSDTGKRRLDLVHKEVHPRVLVQQLLGDSSRGIGYFVRHQFQARWQRQECRRNVAALHTDIGHGAIVVKMDFSETHKLEFANEVQSLHWNSTSVAILVMVIYRHAHPSLDVDVDGVTPIESSPGEPKVVKEYFYFVSDDTNHDSVFVDHAFFMFLSHHYPQLARDGRIPRQMLMPSTGGHGALPPPSKIYIWSDGCGAQFKSRHKFYDEAMTAQMVDIDIIHNYHESYHGKDEYDPAGGQVRFLLLMSWVLGIVCILWHHGGMLCKSTRIAWWYIV